MPRCKICKEVFKQYEFNNKFCKQIDCQVQKALYRLGKKRTAEKKAWNKEKKEIKESLKTWINYYQEALVVFNRYIRERDKNLPCISCDAPAGSYKITSGHFYPQGQYRGLGLNEDNAHGQCWFNCNKNRHGNLTEYRPRLINKIGIRRVEHLDSIRNDLIKPSIPRLIELKVIYKDKIKDLKE